MEDAGLPSPLGKRYRPVRVLGKGACGRVVLASDEELRRTVAIKLMDPRLSQDPEWRGRFDREARLMAKVQSPRIVPVFDHGVAEDTPYIVMRFLAGGSLAERVKAAGGRLPATEALRLLDQILEGLGILHGAGVVHRDLKPENVLLDESGGAVLTDLGLSRELTGEGFTRTGAVVGTGIYMAPEQMEGAKPSTHWDTYAAALLTWWMATGTFPWAMTNFTAVLLQKRTAPVPDLAGKGVEGPAGLDGLLAAMLAPDPARRLGDVDEIRRRLGVIRSGGGRTTGARKALGSAGLSSPVRSEGRGRAVRRLSAAAGVVAIGLALAAGWRAGPASERPIPTDPEPTPATVAPVPAGPDPMVLALRRLADAAEEDPFVRQALALPDGTERGLAGRLWVQGGEAFSRRTREFAELVPRLLARGVDREAWEPLSRLIRTGMLLSTGRAEGVESGIGEAVRGALLEVARPAMGSRREASLDGSQGVPVAERVERARLELGTGGRSLVVARRDRRQADQEGKPVALDPRLRVMDHFGTRFRDPEEGAPEILGLMGRSALGGRRSEGAPDQVSFELAGFEGDLVLVLALQDWNPSILLELEAIGSTAGARFPFRVLPPLQSGSGEKGRVGMALRVSGGLLPPGVRAITIRALGIQVIGHPSPTVQVWAALQQVSGPPLAGLQAG